MTEARPVLDEILDRLRGLPPDELAKASAEAEALIGNKPFIPNAGRQTEAYLSKADVLFYGGAAGGGKSYMLIGTAANDHKSSIVFRRELAQTDGLEKTGKDIIGQAASFNGSDHEWTWPDGRSLKLAGLKEPDDWIKHAGRERDYAGFDEAPEMLEEQVASLMAWVRGPKGQRCRVILAGNPPRLAEGQWVKRWFAPWLDPAFHNPAVAGELRWAVHVDGEIHWVDGADEVEIGGEKYLPKSYTFIPALLADNPYRDTPEYRSQLQSLREPLRSQMLYGDFSAGEKDHEFQLIPTAWIRAAQERWKPRPPEGVAMTTIAVDPAGGGGDAAEIIARYGWWFSEPVTTVGAETADGSRMAALVIRHRRDNCPVIMDVGGGYGGATRLRLQDNGIEVVGFNGSASVAKRSKAGQPFANKRSAAWWTLMEALDPDQEGGSVVALPPNAEVLSDLSAPRWTMTARGIQVESKIERGADGKITGGLRKRLGRSTGKADCIIMALFEGDRVVMRQKSKQRFGAVKVQLGYANMKKRRA